MGDIVLQRFKVAADELFRHCFKRFEVVFLQIRRCERNEHIIMRQADKLLFVHQFSHIVMLEHFKECTHKAFHSPVYFFADETAFVYLRESLLLGVFRFKEFFSLEKLTVNCGEVGLEHKCERKAVLLLHHLRKVGMAEACTVGFDADIWFHHRCAHYIFDRSLLKHIPHTAYRAAALRFEHIAYRDS